MNNESETASDRKSTPEDYHMLYTVSCSDIEFFKRQQVAVTNYTALIYVALITLETQIPSHSPPSGVLIALIVIVAVGATALLCTLQADISARRTRLKRCRNRLGEEFKKAWDVRKPQDIFSGMLYFVVAVGAALAAYLVSAC